jgi:phosphonopyruvate decarboxylase
MINPNEFYKTLSKHSKFITGVPDSLLKDLNSCILDVHPKSKHVIAPNEGISISLSIGNYIASGDIPLVYMQNSGIGNAINPLISLADKDVYGIPMVILIGWRGEPGTKDEPQHYKQGLIQEDLLNSLQIPYFKLNSNSLDFSDTVSKAYELASEVSCPVVLLVSKGTFSKYNEVSLEAKTRLTRENAIKLVIDSVSDNSVFIGTTGKASRELYEVRQSKNQDTNIDFLTVGGMGHASSIAAGISMDTDKNVVCLDGDGALLMHMGALVSNVSVASSNFLHVILNNEVHDSVGGQPTMINKVNLSQLALSVGYKQAIRCENEEDFKLALNEYEKTQGPFLIEFLVSAGSRAELGRPKESPKQNLAAFMNDLKNN